MIVRYIYYVPNPLQEYREALRTIYLKHGTEIPVVGDQASSFPPVHKKEHVCLALVKLEPVDLSRERLARETIRDSVDDIMHASRCLKCTRSNYPTTQSKNLFNSLLWVYFFIGYGHQ